MTSYVALLRGINVGKAKRIPMADLREVFAQLAMTSVKTLLQSGNVVFQSATVPDPAVIQAAVLARTGVSSTVLVLSENDFRAVALADPMLQVCDDPSRQVIAFLDRPIPKLDLPDAGSLAPEQIAQGERALYQWLPLGVLQTKLPSSFWKQVTITGAVSTARNRRTVDKLLAILDGMPAS